MQVSGSHSYRAREDRRKVLIAARMKQDTGWTDVCIRNISSHGLLLQTASAPRPGSYVEVRRGNYVIIARVVWAKESEFGARTQDRLPVDSLVCQPAKPGPATLSPSGLIERRAVARKPTLAQAHERSRRLSSAIEAGSLAVASVASAYFLLSSLHDAFSAPLSVVASSL